MVDALTSFFKVLKLETPFDADLSITNSNSVIGVKFNLRRRITEPGTSINENREYDAFVGSADNTSGQLDLGVDIITVESLNQATDQIFVNFIIPRRTTKVSFQAIPLTTREEKTVYDLAITSTGALGGFGQANLLIRTFSQDYLADNIGQLIVAINNLGSFFAYDIVERHIPNSNDIVYDLFVLYDPV